VPVGPLLGGSYIIDRYVGLYSLTFSEQDELYRLTHADLFELIGQIGHTPHSLTICSDDDIAVRPRRRNDRRVDADNVATGIEQGASRIARVHSRIGLDDVGNFVAGAGRQTALESADHAGCQ
jgi:hypothetical protein